MADWLDLCASQSRCMVGTRKFPSGKPPPVVALSFFSHKVVYERLKQSFWAPAVVWPLPLAKGRDPSSKVCHVRVFRKEQVSFCATGTQVSAESGRYADILGRQHRRARLLGHAIARRTNEATADAHSCCAPLKHGKLLWSEAKAST
jgi:hypothetical protein